MEQLLPEGFYQLEILKNWNVLSKIGTGGNGHVYRLEKKTNPQEISALKWIHIEKRGETSSESFLAAQAQIINEIRTQLTLSDIPQVVSIRDYAVLNSPDGKTIDAFIRMDLLCPMTQWMAEGNHTVNEILAMLKDISIAVDACHKAGIVHRDIKPDNILCNDKNFMLSDFGVAGIMRDHDRQTRFTRNFAPPEYEQSGRVDQSGDLYSLGLTAYLLFNNDLMPYQDNFGRDAKNRAWAARLEAVQSGHQLYPPPKYAPTEEIAGILCRACAIDSRERFSSAMEFYTELEKALQKADRFWNAILPYRNAALCTMDSMSVSGDPPAQQTRSGAETQTGNAENNSSATDGKTGRGFDSGSSTGRTTKSVLGAADSERIKRGDNSPKEQTETKGGVVLDFSNADTGSGSSSGKAPTYGEETKETIQPKKKTKRVVVILLAIVLAIGAGVYFFINRPVVHPTFTAKASGCTVTIEGKEQRDYTYYPEDNSGYLTQQSFGARHEIAGSLNSISGQYELKNLLPDTKFILEDSFGAKLSVQTSSLPQGKSSVSSGYIDLYSAGWDNADYFATLAGSELMPKVNQIQLQNSGAENQSRCYYIDLHVTWKEGQRPTLALGRLILRCAGGKLFTTVFDFDESFISTQNSYPRCVIKASDLINEMVRINGAVQYGETSLDIYMGETKLGHTDFTITKEG